MSSREGDLFDYFARRDQPRRSRKKRRVATDEEADHTTPPPLLQTDILTLVFVYLDVADVSSVAATSKVWNETFRLVEESFFLVLIRKHYPTVETITNRLPAHIGEYRPADAADTVSNGNSALTLPPPSRSWKHQFHRAQVLSRQERTENPPSNDGPEPKPLSKYLFQVGLTLFKEEKGQPREKVGVVSRIVDDAKFGNERIILPPLNDLEELGQFDFTDFDISVVMIDSASGKQALVFKGGIDGILEFNSFTCEPHRLVKNIFIIDGLDDTRIFSELRVEKTGCLCTCIGGDHWRFFTKPPPCPCNGEEKWQNFWEKKACCENKCTCCSCKISWECFWNMKMELSISVAWEWDLVELTESQKLRLFEDHIVFK